jgi:hypothetical protein
MPATDASGAHNPYGTIIDPFLRSLYVLYDWNESEHFRMHSLSIPRSPERLAFAHFLRTGWRLPDSAFELDHEPLEAKFNPYHDPQNGQFTFGPGGAAVSDGVYRPGDGAPSLILTGSELPPGLGDNSGRFRDPMTLDQTFPGLANAPAGAIIAVADPFLDLTGPGSQITSAMSLAYSQNLIAQIQAIDPTYRYERWISGHVRRPDARDQRSPLGSRDGDLQCDGGHRAAASRDVALSAGSDGRRI